MTDQLNSSVILYNRFFCKFNTVKELPIISAFYETDDYMPSNYTHCEFHAAFYDTNGNIVTPTTGTIQCQVSAIHGIWHTLAENGTIQANCIKPTGDYIIPCFHGYARQARIAMQGVPPNEASFAQCFVIRY